MGPGNAGGLTGQKLGDYHLHALLGVGGMAEVYRALDVSLGREVAVKVLPASLASDPGYVERFRSEGRNVAALNHPHIVPVYYFGSENDLLYLVMPVLRESLRDRLDREHRLPLAEAARLTVQIASALDAAHARGVVHRDVKPENILINDEGRVLLTDFGIARELSFLRKTSTSRTLASTGLPVGTPEYMAPEQLRGADLDQRVDVYALGAVLYELMTGQVPFDAETPYEVAALVLTAPLMPPSERNSEIGPELEQVMLTALARDADDRYGDARSFAIALRQAMVAQNAFEAGDLPRWAPRTQRLALAGTLGSGPLGNPGTGVAVLQAPDDPTIPLDTLSAGSVGVPLRQRLRGKTAAAVVAIGLLVIVGLCGGSALAILNGFNTLPGGASLLPGFTQQSTAQTGQSGTGSATPPNATSTSGGSASGSVSTGKTGGSSATSQPGPGQPPQPTSPAGSPPPGSTATPTPTPVPPIQVTFSPQNMTHNSTKNICTVSQTVANHSNTTVSWLWSSVSPNSGSPDWSKYYMGYQISGPSGQSNGASLPSDTQLGANSSDTVTVWLKSCPSHAGWTITATDSVDANSQQLTLTVP